MRILGWYLISWGLASSFLISQEWKKIRADFEVRFESPSPQKKVEAIHSLKPVLHKEILRLCFTLLEVPDQKLISLERQQERLLALWLAEKEKLSQLLLKNFATLPEKAMEDFQKIDKELLKIEQEIAQYSLVPYAVKEVLASLSEKNLQDTLLKEGLNHRNWRVQVAVLQALQKMTLPKEILLPALLKLLHEEKSPTIRSSLCDTLASQQIYEGLDVLYPLLEEKAWQVRLAVYAALGRLKHEKSIPLLIQQFEKEEGRFLQEIENALKSITGVTFHLNALLWQQWHQKNLSFTVPRPLDPKNLSPSNSTDSSESTLLLTPKALQPVAKGTSYYGIHTLSKNLIFVLDVSGSMNEPATLKGKTAIYGSAGETTKLEVAKSQLKQAILGLDESAEFLISTYSDKVQWWSKKKMPAKKRNKEAALHFLETLKADGATNIYDALNSAFHLAGRGAFDKSYETSVDTIFFLTDGEPTTGPLIEPELILNSVLEWNTLRKIQIHTIGVGEHNKSFMQRLAAQHQGQYVSD
jgi:hypothetical protein